MGCNREFEIKPGTTYAFDLDQNGFPTFTKKNVAFVTAIIGYDSNYSLASATGNYEEIFAEPDFWDFNKLYEAIVSIDKINSTHLASEGSGVKGGHGREITTAFIKEIGGETLKRRLTNADPMLVWEIANAVKTKYNFSFASKFCVYASKHALGVDHYCIYDNIVQAVLPYYFYIYVDGEEYRRFYKTKKGGNNESILNELFKQKENIDGYKNYRECVDKIIAGIEKKCGVHLEYKEFDNILWYCFKGSDTRVQAAMNCLPKK